MNRPVLASAIVLAVVSLLVFYKAYGPQKCHWRRAALDIGSGTTKMKVADVDICEKRIIKVLLSESVPVNFKASVTKHGHFDAIILEKGYQVVAAMKRKALALKPPAEQFAGVATAAFRQSENAYAWTRQVFRDMRVKVTIIDQDREARMGYSAATQYASSQPKNVLVWDIGGGSMQMAKVVRGKKEFYRGELASESFKNYIIETLQQKNLQSHSTPNPMGTKVAGLALEYAKRIAIESVPLPLKDQVATSEIVGIGGVHYFSLRRQLSLQEGELITQAKIQRAIGERARWPDEKFEDEFASTQLSNLILVLGYMQALGIDKVKPVPVNLADGLFFEEDLWRRKLILNEAS